jgi:hypothetical protein
MIHVPADRHVATKQIARWFDWEHLPVGLARGVSQSCAQLAEGVIEELPDSPELTTGLRKLLEAKDCFVRAAIGAQGAAVTEPGPRAEITE